MFSPPAWSLPKRTIGRAQQGVRCLLWAVSGAIFLLLLSSLFRVPDVPVPVAAALFAFVVFAAYRPAAAILVVAAVVPIASWTGRQWNGRVAWPEVVAMAYLAGYAARKVIERHRERITRPQLVR